MRASPGARIGRPASHGHAIVLAVGLLAVALLALCSGTGFAAPGITSVEPGRVGGDLTAAVRTARLPGDRIASSLESGLPSAIQMDLRVVDGRDRVVGENRVFLRLAFDLWDEVFRVEGAGAEHRFADLESLRTFLEHVPRLPVVPIGSLRAAEPHRIRVGMRLHPVAPRETERLGDWVARGPGGQTAVTEDPDGRETSVSLGEVIRFFYRGARRRDADESERFSAWFVPAELPEPEEGDAPDPH